MSDVTSAERFNADSDWAALSRRGLV